jgi:hypothetical protein
MMRGLRKAFKISIPVGIITAFGIWGSTTHAAQSSETPLSDSLSSKSPPAPPWVNPDGSIDESKVPDRIGVVGPDGLPLLDAYGNQVTISSDELFGGPDLPPGLPAPEDSAIHHVIEHADGLVEEIVEDDDSEYGFGD